MPKTWDKSYQWILEHKEKLDNNLKKLSKEAAEVEKQQDNALKNIDYKIDECKNQLKNQHNKIVPKQNDLQAKKIELQNNIAECARNHQEYKNKLKEAEIDEGRNKNIIYTQTENIKSDERTKMDYTKIRDKMVDASQYVDEGATKLESKIDYRGRLSALERDIDAADKSIAKQEYVLENKNQSVKDKLDVQMEQAKSGINKVSKSHIDTIDSC